MKKIVLLMIVIVLMAAATVYADTYPESPHPYGNDLDQTWTYTAAAGTERMDVTFSEQTNVEEDFDYIDLLNGNGGLLGTYTGTALAGQTITIEGDSFGVRLYTDDSNDGDFYGFAVTNVVEHAAVPVTITSLTPSAATADKGDSVTWTVTADGTSAPFTYVYQLLKDGEVINTSASTSSATYTATLAANGVYTVCVTATDSKGQTATYTGGDVVVDTLEIQSVIAADTLVKTNTPMVWTVTASGGLQPYRYAYQLYYADGTLEEEQDYSASATYTKTLKKLDSFYVVATVQDANGSIVTMTGDTITLYKTLSVGSITADVTSAVAGDVITWTATISGGRGVVTSTYEITCDGAVQTTLVYNDVSSIQYAPLTPGRYACTVTSTDEENTVITKTSGTVDVTEMAATDPSLFTYTTIDGLTAKVTGYTGSASAIRIPDAIDGFTITQIADSAFKNKGALRSVVIPDTVTTIGSSAFYGCTALVNIDFGQGVKSIGNSAFYSCDRLVAVHLPEGLTSLGSSVFQNCSRLAYANHPTTLTSAGEKCFLGTAMKHFTVDEGATVLASNFFKGCTNITSITLPSTLTSIGNGAFQNHNTLTAITLPDSITAIGNSAFEACVKLTSIDLPDSLKTIGSYAFEGCTGLTELDFPNGLTTVNYQAFVNCTALREANLPDTVTTIGAGAFMNCTALEYFHYPLQWASASSTNGGILSGCKLIRSVTVPEGVTMIPNEAFAGASYLSEVVLPNSLTTIKSSAFSSSGLTSIVIPTSVTSIAANAFYGSSALASATIYPGVTSIGNNAFANTSADLVIRCYSGSTAETYANNNSITVELMEGDWMNWRITAGGVLQVFGDGPMSDYASGGAPWADQVEEITAIHIGSGITSIGNYSFTNLTEVGSAVIPSTVTRIGTGAFSGCIDLGRVFIDETVTSIGTDAFKNCVRLTIVCFDGSAAHNYAVANGLSSEPITVTFTLQNASLTVLRGSVLGLPSPLFVVEPEGTIGSGWTGTTSNTAVISWTDSNMRAAGVGTATLTFSLKQHPTTERTVQVTVVNSLNTMSLPAALTTLENEALSGVAAERVILPSGMTSIASNALSGMSNLKQLVVTNSTLHLPSSLLSSSGSAIVICPKNSAAAEDCKEFGIPYLYAQ